MTGTVLTLRLSRRALGAVVLADEVLTLSDGRHLSSRGDRPIHAATGYVSRLIDLLRPTYLVIDAPPRVTGRTTDRILASLEALASSRGISLLTVGRSEVLASYGLHGLRNRRELRELARQFWPELQRITGRVEPYVADAAGTALYAECRLGWERMQR